MSSISKVMSCVSKTEGWLSEEEALFLYQIAKEGPGIGEIVEIGSWKGKSTICLASGSKIVHREKVTAIDPHEGIYSEVKKVPSTYKEFIKNLEKASIKDWVIPIVKTSKEASLSWGKGIRLLFIDGLHDYKNTYQDFKLWEPFIKSGGIIALHDAYCGYDGPQRVMSENLIKNLKFSNFGIAGSIFYVRKKPAKSLLEKLDRIRFSIFIPIVLKIIKIPFPNVLNFIIFHKLIKFMLISRYTGKHYDKRQHK